MKTFRQFIIENKEKKSFVGNCKNSFDLDGECVIDSLPYRDTTDFAQGEETSKKISKEEFSKHANIPKHLEKIHNSKNTVHMHDEKNDVLMMYDTKKDIHHFFR